MRIVLFLLLFVSCQDNYSAFNTWKNGNVRELNLSEKTSTLKDLENECDYLGEIEGNTKSGWIGPFLLLLHKRQNNYFLPKGLLVIPHRIGRLNYS